VSDSLAGPSAGGAMPLPVWHRAGSAPPSRLEFASVVNEFEPAPAGATLARMSPMIRRLALLAALLGPATAFAQAAGEVIITPSAFGRSDCTSTDKLVTLSWNSSVVPVTGDLYRILVSTTSGCPTGSTTTLADNLSATTAIQGYPTTGSTLTRQAFVQAAGITDCTANATIFVCVQHWPSNGSSGTLKATATGNAALEVSPPPIPINVSVSPGDSALFVSWTDGTLNADGTTSTVAATSYNVTATNPLVATDTRTRNFTGKTNQRISGLTNGTTYDVTVTAVSAGGNESASSLAATGQPAPVSGFWEQYRAAGGIEQGGCGGGAAGVGSLLVLALALAAARRRP
jgi:hypothetical protein